jgi:hypothetical protein
VREPCGAQDLAEVVPYEEGVPAPNGLGGGEHHDGETVALRDAVVVLHGAVVALHGVVVAPHDAVVALDGGVVDAWNVAAGEHGRVSEGSRGSEGEGAQWAGVKNAGQDAGHRVSQFPQGTWRPGVEADAAAQEVEDGLEPRRPSS